MLTVLESVKKNVKGLHYGNRLILPFKANFLKIGVDKEIITDLSDLGGLVHIKETDTYTEIYFYKTGNLIDKVSKHEAVKMILVEKQDDIFDPDDHLKIALYLEDKHLVKIEKIEDDIIFIE
jgi:hypothetical protein